MHSQRLPVGRDTYCWQELLTHSESPPRWLAASSARRVFAWGTSFAGMYIVELAVSDARLAGAIGQAPLVDIDVGVGGRVA